MVSVVAALVIGLWIVFRPHPLVGVRILPDLDIDEVARVDVDGKPILSLQDGKWSIDAYDGYPADGKMVAEFFHSLTNLTVWEVEDDPKKIERFREYPFPLTLRDSSGRVLAELLVGYYKHGVAHSGWVESTFTVDGSYLSFSNEVVAVREPFKMFHGHDLCFDGFADDWLHLILPLRNIYGEAVPPTYECRVFIAGEDERLEFAVLDAPTNGWQYAYSCELADLRDGETVNVERARQFIRDLRYIPTWEPRRVSRISKEERAAEKRRRTYVVRSLDGKDSCERTFSLYEGKNGMRLEMDGWDYQVGRNTADALYVKRKDLVLPCKHETRLNTQEGVLIERRFCPVCA